MTKKIVLAFSGGLDTSYCVLDLIQQGFEVHTAFIDSGGSDEQGRAAIRARAKNLGATRHHEINVAQEIWDEFVTPLVWSHARMLGEYPLLCSDRYLIVKHCLALCDELETQHFGHGCTGMGNDQLRFDQAVRDYELRFMADAGFEVEAAASRYSINENLLGVTISGSEIDEFQPPAGDAWTMTAGRRDWPESTLQVSVGFEQGIAVSLDGEKLDGPQILQKLNLLLGAYGVGRHIYTGDVTIGLKGRIAFECPGIDGLLVAHQALEDTVNTRFQNQFRSQVANRWAELVYTGFFYEPHKADLEAYLKSSQAVVTGEAILHTDGGRVMAVTVNSPYRLQHPGAVYAQSCDWTPEEAVGFIKLFGQSTTLAGKVRGKCG
jgi:argininosuccinate synthase